MNIKRLLPFLLFLLLCYGIFLRMYDLGSQSFWIDESYSIVIGQAIADHGYPLVDSGKIINRAPVFHYPLAGMILLFGDSAVAMRFLSVVFGAAAILLISWTAKLWFSNRTAIWVFLLLNFSYWQIAWSRQARMYMLLLLLFWIGMLACERLLQNKQHRGWWWATLIMSDLLIIGTHDFGALLVVAQFFGFLLHKGIHTIKNQQLFSGLYLLSLVALSSSCVIAIGLRSDFPFPLHYDMHYMSFLLREYWVLLLLAVVGIIHTLQKNNRFILLWLFGVSIIGWSVFSFGVALLQYRYLFFLTPIILLFAAAGIDWLWQQKNLVRFTALPLILILLIWQKELIVLPQSTYILESDSPTSSFQYKSFTPQPDYNAAYTFIATQKPDQVITAYPTISRLYGMEDSLVIGIDLVGGQPHRTQLPELYTGIHAISMTDLETLLQDNKRTYIVIDRLTQNRMDSSIKTTLDKRGKIIYSVRDHFPWSALIIYEI